MTPLHAASSNQLFQSSTSRCWKVLATLLLTPVVGFAQAFVEAEGNSSKSLANPVVFTTPGDGALGTIVGNSTGGTIGTSTAQASADFFLVTVPPAVPGVYRYEFVITTTGTAGHIGSIRGLTQTASGITAGSDFGFQFSSATTPVPRSNTFYTFGGSPQIYYAVTGSFSSTADYTATLSRSTVVPHVVTTVVAPGPVTISTVGQTTADTEFLVYTEAGLPVMRAGVGSFKNDGESLVGGGSGTTSQSLATGTLAPGVYYIAISDNNTNDNLVRPSDDSVATSPVLDLPGVIANSGTVVPRTLNLQISTGCQSISVPLAKTVPFSVQFVRFEVGAVDIPCTVVSVAPGTVAPGTPVTVTAVVTPAQTGATAITGVVANAASIGGGVVALADNGVAPDATAGDNVWTGTVPTSPPQPTTRVTFSVTTTDAAGRSTTAPASVVFAPVPPSNDTCSNALPVTSLPAVFQVINEFATDDPDVSCNNATVALDGVWFTYTPAQDCYLQMSEIGSGVGSQDVSFTAYDGSCGSLVERFCTDAETNVGFLAHAGVTYYILVSRYENPGIPAPAVFFTVSFQSCQSLPRPANDDCQTATVIPPSGISDIQFNGGAYHDIDVPCNFNAVVPASYNGVWYTLTPSVDCQATITEDGPQDATISVFTGSCASLTQTLCSGPEVNIGVPMSAGVSYYVLVSRMLSTLPAGPADFWSVTINCQPVNPPGVCCRGAVCGIDTSTNCVPSGTAGAVFHSGTLACNSGSTTSPCCFADYNKSDGVTTQDIFDFLNGWFAVSPFADTGSDGTTTPEVQSIFDFLSAWFAAGC